MKKKNTPRERLMAPKGYTDHDPAGSKMARLAKEKRLGLRHGAMKGK